jgi:hypothetical protein
MEERKRSLSTDYTDYTDFKNGKIFLRDFFFILPICVIGVICGYNSSSRRFPSSNLRKSSQSADKNSSENLPLLKSVKSV